MSYIKRGVLKVAENLPDESRTPDEEEEIEVTHALDRIPEFSQQQLHEMVDMAVERLCIEGKVPSGFFNEVAVIIKNGFPVGLDVACDDPFFFREQVQHVLDFVAEKSGEMLAQRALDQR